MYDIDRRAREGWLKLQLRGRGRQGHGPRGQQRGFVSVAVMAHGLVRLESVAEVTRAQEEDPGR